MNRKKKYQSIIRKLFNKQVSKEELNGLIKKLNMEENSFSEEVLQIWNKAAIKKMGGVVDPTQAFQKTWKKIETAEREKKQHHSME